MTVHVLNIFEGRFQEFSSLYLHSAINRQYTSRFIDRIHIPKNCTSFL